LLFKASNYYYYYFRLTAFFPEQPGHSGTRKVNHSGFYCSKRYGVAMASAEPYANNLHLAIDR